MLRTLICTVAACALAAPSALGGEFSDPANTFRLSAPEGWTAETSPVPDIPLIIVSPRRLETGGNCNVVVLQMAQTNSMSQAELDAQLAGQFDEAYWRGMFATVRGIKSTSIDKWGDKTKRGRKVYYVKATSEAEVNGVALKVTTLQDIHPTPGRGYTVTCTVRTAGLEREASDFASIMESFEPIPDMTVAAMRQPSTFPPHARGGLAIARAASMAATDALAAGLARAR